MPQTTKIHRKNDGKTSLTTSLATSSSPPAPHHQRLTNQASRTVLTYPWYPHQPFQLNGRAVVPALPVQLGLLAPIGLKIWDQAFLDLGIQKIHSVRPNSVQTKLFFGFSLPPISKLTLRLTLKSSLKLTLKLTHQGSPRTWYIKHIVRTIYL